MSGIRSESLVMVSPEVSQAVPLRSRRGCLVAVVVKAALAGGVVRAAQAWSSRADRAGESGPFPRVGSMHDSCPDCAGTQPKRTIIPVYPESQSVTGWAGPVTG